MSELTCSAILMPAFPDCSQGGLLGLLPEIEELCPKVYGLPHYLYHPCLYNMYQVSEMAQCVDRVGEDYIFTFADVNGGYFKSFYSRCDKETTGQWDK